MKTNTWLLVIYVLGMLLFSGLLKLNLGGEQVTVPQLVQAYMTAKEKK